MREGNFCKHAVSHQSINEPHLVGVPAHGHREAARQSKVRDLEGAPSVHQQVLGLEVPVHDAAAVTCIHALQDLVQVGLVVGGWTAQRREERVMSGEERGGRSVLGGGGGATAERMANAATSSMSTAGRRGQCSRLKGGGTCRSCGVCWCKRVCRASVVVGARVCEAMC